MEADGGLRQGGRTDISNHRQRRLLRLRRERPRRCAAKQRNEVAPFHERPSWEGAAYHIVK